MNNMTSVFVMALIVAAGGIVASLPTMTNTAFAEKCKDVSDGVHCSGKGTLNGQAGNFKCDFDDNECSFSGAGSPGQGGRCTGDLAGPTECNGNLDPEDFPLGQ